MPATGRYFAWGCFRYFSLGARITLRLGSAACQAVARGTRPPSPKWASARQPSLASRAKAGGPGRTRTCNQTVMSGRISVRFVDFAAVSSAFDRVRCGLIRSFLVRNWCGPQSRLGCVNLGWANNAWCRKPSLSRERRKSPTQAKPLLFLTQRGHCSAIVLSRRLLPQPNYLQRRYFVLETFVLRTTSRNARMIRLVSRFRKITTCA
jgi:hypothetical protein